ncbi:unnamed protein product [Periconia digitata]|uniref:Uncharacterized protein n=1 Tax=Periconia digitata TaxID=1303443 RepID=A0A9W4XN74_9PLEO|nr:unnamed protein product [Periconia digitata]
MLPVPPCPASLKRVECYGLELCYEFQNFRNDRTSTKSSGDLPAWVQYTIEQRSIQIFNKKRSCCMFRNWIPHFPGPFTRTDSSFSIFHFTKPCFIFHFQLPVNFISL